MLTPENRSVTLTHAQLTKNGILMRIPILEKAGDALSQPVGTEYPTANKECPMKKERQYDLQDRPVDYAVRIIKFAVVFTSIETARQNKER